MSLDAFKTPQNRVNSSVRLRNHPGRDLNPPGGLLTCNNFGTPKSSTNAANSTVALFQSPEKCFTELLLRNLEIKITTTTIDLWVAWLAPYTADLMKDGLAHLFLDKRK